MQWRRRVQVAAGLAAITVLAAGCSTSDPDQASADSGGSMSISWGTPENPLVPANTTETQGGVVVDALFTGLINYHPKTGESVLANAESIASEDGLTWTVKLRSGWTWHDGSPVVAQDYVDAWNYAAHSPNGMANGSFFADIKGYDRVHTDDPDGEGPLAAPKPAADKLSGLTVVDGSTFTVTLNGPSNLWPLKVGYSAFMPLPKSFFADPAAFGENPIGNGPFKLVKWTKNVELVVTRFDEYRGTDKAKLKDVVFRVYTDASAAYADVQGGTLDFQQQVPSSVLKNAKYKADFGGRAANNPVTVSLFLEFPKYRPEYRTQVPPGSFDGDRPSSLSRRSSTARGSRWPVGSTNVGGYKADQCGEFCVFNPARARTCSGRPAASPAALDRLQRRRGAQGLGGGDLQQHPDHAGHQVCRQAVPDVRRVPDAGQRARDDQHVALRLAGGLPVHRELAQPSAADRGFLQRWPLQQSGVGCEASAGRWHQGSGQCGEALSGGRGDAARRDADHPDVALRATVRVE
jgi:oligopeptide transport system substrate-binding protein